jgi:ubiquinol-cytochrome c reductase cytochrome b subunit
MHPANYEKANPMVTPTHIVPEWYFLPFYTVLESIPGKGGGILGMGFSIIAIFLLPLLDKGTIIKTPKVRIIWRFFFWSFVFNFIFLGWLGEQPAEEFYVTLGRVSTFYYFFFLTVLLPFIGKLETEEVLQKKI